MIPRAISSRHAALEPQGAASAQLVCAMDVATEYHPMREAAGKDVR